MLHTRSSVNGIFILQNDGVPSSLTTDFGEAIKSGSLCVDNNNDDLYILKGAIWTLIGGSGTSGATDFTYPKGIVTYVNGINGDDSTGERGDFFKPFATITEAENATTSGDTIMITTMQFEEYTLGKDGINYHFLPGTGITNNGVASQAVNQSFTDIGKTNNGANPLNFKITGFGEFTNTTVDGSACSFLYIYEGSTVEFEIQSSTIIDSRAETWEDGWHFWNQAEYINGAGAGKMSYLKGKVKGNVTGGHYFIGNHSGNCNIDVGGNVSVSAIFCQAEGTQLVDINVDGKITCGYSTNQTFKYFLLADRVPFFTGNTDTITGTNTIKITAKRAEWLNDGAEQWSGWGIINCIEYNDATATHNLNYVDLNIDEFLVRSGNQATQRGVIKLNNNNSSTYSKIKFNNSKLTIEDGFPLTDISNSVEKEYMDIIYKDCSIDYQHTSLGTNGVIMESRYAMINFDNTRFKVSSQGVTDSYIILDDSTDTDKEFAVYGGGLYTNGFLPNDLVNINTELPLSIDTTNIYQGLTKIRII